jgi:rare lipoprotein A
VASCSQAERGADIRMGRGTPASPRVISDGEPVPKGGGIYKVGEPYQIDGQWFAPREEPAYDRSGIASYYAEDFHGRRTSNGEVFDMWALTAAHPTLPLPSYAYVTNLDNGRTLLVRVNDRGPYARSRVIDVSRGVARYLGFESQGTARVRVRYAGPAPMLGEDRNEQRFLADQPWFRTALSRAVELMDKR